MTIITIILTICNVTFSQGRRDLGTYANYKYELNDSIKKKLADSLGIAYDSTRLAPVDSLSRIKYFQYKPEYTFGTKIKDKTHPLLLENSSLVKTEISFGDSNKVIIRQTINGEDLKAPLVIGFEEYLSKKVNLNEEKIFYELFSDKFKGVTTDDLTRLFEKFTDITIPLPFKTETIFGPPTFNLRINGAVDITASYQNNNVTSLSFTNNNQSNINFKQEVQVTAKGTIGDKLTIDADWNTQRVFDFENQLKIKYTGYADEVIQKIEAGNVSLETKSSLIQSTQALFGIRGEFKLGPLTLSSVVSQKKSKQEEKTFSQGVQDQNFQLSVWDYSDSHYLLDTLYKHSFNVVYNDTLGKQYDAFVWENRINTANNNFEVWIQCQVTESKKRFAVGKVMLGPRPVAGYDTSVTNPVTVLGDKFTGYFRKLEENEYRVDEYAGFVSLKLSVPETYYVGVVYNTYKATDNIFGKGTRPGESNGNDTLILKLVKVDTPDPLTTPLAWELKMKNIYRLPVSRILEDGFVLDALFNNNNVFQKNIVNLNNSLSLSTILNIDRYAGKNTRFAPDGVFDFLTGRTILTESGDIIFPNLRPFSDNISIAGADTTFQFSEIYTQKKDVARTSLKASLYVLKGSAKGESGISNSFNLGLNIVSGSVAVFLGQQKLTENVDYSCDYTTGVVVIRNSAALTSKDLRITYESNDLFSLASKTFIGLRGDYKIDEKTNFGFTFVNLIQETLNDKVRIGEEPTNNSMFGADLTTEFKPNFLTKALNLLPGFNTKEESVLSLRGEVAYLTPDPNTKKSRIPSDNNEAIAYIDDMEGAKKIISLGTNYQSWSIASVPFEQDSVNVNDSIMQDRRASLKWYTLPNDVEVKSVYPLRDVQAGQDRLSPFYMFFDPSKRGTYNYLQNGFDTLNSRKSKWNGIMKYMNSTSPDLVNENINFIEFNMRIENYDNVNLADAKLFVDLGLISEDGIPNGTLNTEDANNNGTLQEEEDRGLDYLRDNGELILFNQRNGTTYDLSQLPDPAGDNNSNSPTINIDLVNGTEGNRFVEGFNRPDTEDLDGNGVLDKTNKYYEYFVSLDTTNNKMITGKGAPGSGWFQYRIPLSEFKRNIGEREATLNNVKYVRVWLRGLDGKVRLGLIDFNLVGNQWYKPNKTDTTYNISVVSIEENSQIYMSPVPGDVLRQTVRNTSGVNTKSNEQSLAMSFNNLSVGQQKIAVKDYRSQVLDLFNYKMMKLFVNGDPSFNYTNQFIYDATMVIRFGSDSTNFYEYRAPIHPDVRPGQPWNSQNEVSIVFADLTSLKISRDSANQIVDMPVPNGPPGSYYRVRGTPALNAIREFTLGVEKNRSGLNSSISGSVWFNEVRVLKVNDDNGYAYNVNTSLKIADFANVSLNLSKMDPNFHSLDTRAGTRTTGTNWDLGVSLNAHKLINNFLASVISPEWKDFLNFPVTFRHSENMINPKYYPGSDIDLEKAADEKYKQVMAKTNDPLIASKSRDDFIKSTQTLAVRNDISVTGMAFKFPGNNYITRTVLNAFSVNFTGTFGTQRDFTFESKSDFNVNGSVNYNTDFRLSEILNLQLNKLVNLGEQYKDAKIYLFFPLIPFVPAFSTNFTASMDFTRSRSESRQRLLLQDDPVSRMFRANRGFGFNWKFIENWIVDLTGTYNFKIGSDLSDLETYRDSLRTQRSEKEVLSDIFFNEGLINFGKDLDFQQSTTINPKFNIPVINKFMDVNMNYNVTYAWTNPNSTQNIGYNVGFANTFTTGATFKFNEILNTLGVPKNPSGYRTFSNKLKAASSFDDKIQFGDILKVFSTFIPDLITVNFNQTNSVVNPGVVGRPGLGNFWLALKTVEEYGPSRMYQLGFNRFPGKRVASLNITDVYNLSNNITFNTTISPILPQSIRMNLTFKKLWGFNNSGTYQTTGEGTLGEAINRSSNKTDGYSMFFAGSMEKFDFVPSDSAANNVTNITSAFKSNIASFPFPNWNLTVSGLEKLPLFSEFASTVSLENTFTSEYSEASFNDASNQEVIQRQSVTQSFNPLIGLNITFKPIFGGNMTANLRINSSTSNILTPSSNLIQENKTSDWSLTANYAKSGFDIPLFGLSLKNDITFSLTVSKNVNQPVDWRFTPLIGKEKLDGAGSTVTSFNPSVSYSLSSKVQLMVFYKYSKSEPTEGNATTQPRTTNEGGLNVRVTIQ